MKKIFLALLNWINNYFVTLFVVYMIVCMLIISSLFIGIGEVITRLDQKIEIYEVYRQQEIEGLSQAILDLGTVAMENDLSQLELAKIILKSVKKLKTRQDILKAEMKKKKTVDLDNMKDIKEANISVVNASTSYQGSGTHIKINNVSYILTCAHLIEEQIDYLYAFLDNEVIHPLELVKINKKTDLALFKIFNVEDLSYLEISKESPKEGSEVVIIGNPSNLTDVFTDGVIAKVYKKEGYLLTNLVFYGNSGGAVLYKGKIVGVMSQLRTHYEMPVFVNYGFSSNLDMIKDFLGEI